MDDFDAFSLRLRDGSLEVLDQRLVPLEEVWLPVHSTKDMFTYIERLSVRGAPMLACAAACSLAMEACKSDATPKSIIEQAEYLKTSRPTAVNLAYCCDQVRAVCEAVMSPSTLATAVCRRAQELMAREREMCDAMAANGNALVQHGERLLTHCNTGSLATVGVGTALGVIRAAHVAGKGVHVYVDETRPLLQGGRLTAYELCKEKIPHTLICDSMAASLMRAGCVSRVLVGADRIAVNGDFANKIGTYNLAVIAHHHNVPFHCVAPLSTTDWSCASGDDIPIEMRNEDEVRGHRDTRWAPPQSPCYNPAFDVTPIALVTSIVLDTGVYTREDIQACQGGLQQLVQDRRRKRGE